VPGFFFLSGQLFKVATDAYQRTKHPSDPASLQTDALVAIVFSAAALEGFINEAVEFAALPRPKSPSVALFADLAQEVEKSRGSTRLKFLLASGVFAGRVFNKGGQPYQDFELLMDLRNELVHLKPIDRITGPNAEGLLESKPPAIIKRLRSKRILAKNDPQIATPFTSLISTPAAARWACNAAAGMVEELLKLVPTSKYKSMLHQSAKHFSPVL
jgi:hypothetical protein